MLEKKYAIDLQWGLICACDNGALEIAQLMFEKGAKCTPYAFASACISSRINIMKWMIGKKRNECILDCELYHALDYGLEHMIAIKEPNITVVHHKVILFFIYLGLHLTRKLCQYWHLRGKYIIVLFNLLLNRNIKGCLFINFKITKSILTPLHMTRYMLHLSLKRFFPTCFIHHLIRPFVSR